MTLEPRSLNPTAPLKGFSLFLVTVLLLTYPKDAFSSGSTTYEMPLDVLPSGGARPMSSSFDHPRTSIGEPFGEASSSQSYLMKAPGYLLQLETRYHYQHTEGEGLIDVLGTIDDNSAAVTVVCDNTITATVEAGTFIARDVLLHEGVNTITTTACDLSDNCATQTTHVTLDTHPPSLPTVAVVTPTDITPQLLSGTKQANTALWIDGAEVVPNDTATTWSTSVPLTEGHNPLTLQAVDLAGHQSASLQTDILLDQIPAAVAISSPADGSLMSASSITVTGSVDDADAVMTVSAANSVTASVANGAFSATNLLLSEGANLVTAQATTPMGHVTTAQVTVIRDTTPPAISSVTPELGSVFYEQDPVTISTAASDAGGGALQYQVTVDGLLRQDWGSSPTYTLTPEERDYGERTVTVEARDSLGNASSAQTRFFFMRHPKETPE